MSSARSPLRGNPGVPDLRIAGNQAQIVHVAAPESMLPEWLKTPAASLRLDPDVKRTGSVNTMPCC